MIENHSVCSGVAQLGSSGHVQPNPTEHAQSAQPVAPAIQSDPSQKSDNLNLHAGLLEPQQSRSRACLRQWLVWRLLKGDQSDQSMRQVDHFYKVMYHSSGGLRGTPCKVSC